MTRIAIVLFVCLSTCLFDYTSACLDCDGGLPLLALKGLKDCKKSALANLLAYKKPLLPLLKFGLKEKSCGCKEKFCGCKDKGEYLNLPYGPVPYPQPIFAQPPSLAYGLPVPQSLPAQEPAPLTISLSSLPSAPASPKYIPIPQYIPVPVPAQPNFIPQPQFIAKPQYLPAPQYIAPPAPQYVSAPAPQFVSAPAPQYVSAPAPQYVSAPAPQYLPAPPRYVPAPCANPPQPRIPPIVLRLGTGPNTCGCKV